MKLVEILQGIGIILIIVVVAGGIAYIGDRVGHQVGRKRLTIFNIRPRYTSTIIAVGTGMVIALAITLIAIFASNEVKTAFFKLNALNDEIQKAQARARDLENKVNNEHVCVGLDSVMSTSVGMIPIHASAAVRRQRVHNFYRQTVAYVNRTYAGPPCDLKPFTPPKNLNAVLSDSANGKQVRTWVSQSDVLLVATADQNLYPRDPIHFGITEVRDQLIVPAGQAIASLRIPAAKNVSAQIAVAELLNTWVPREMAGHGMPPFFATNVFARKTLPGIPAMTRMLTTGTGNYLMTAFAASDIYPHTFGVPVIVTLQKVPPR